MIVRQVAVALLLGSGSAVVLLCCVAMSRVRGEYRRLHYLGPSTALAVTAIVVAAVLETGLSTAGFKALLTGVVMVVTGPVLTHATARAAWIREHGEWDTRPEKKEEGQESGVDQGSCQ